MTTGTATIAGLKDHNGSNMPGQTADVVLLRTDERNITPMHDLVGCAVMQAATANIDTVFIAGRAVKQSGKRRTSIRSAAVGFSLIGGV